MSLVKELMELSTRDEEIIDTFRSKEILCDKIFDRNAKMRRVIKTRLLKIVEEFIDFVGIEMFVHDVTLTGSLANFNWSSYSDVDLHILVDYEELADSKPGVIEIMKELFDAKKNLWNNRHLITIKKFDVEIYVQDINDAHHSTGVYSVMNDEWIVKPEKSENAIEEKKILVKADQIAKQIDALTVCDSDNTTELIKKVETLRKKIKNFRQSGLERGGEYSYENLTFKLLRRNGYIKKLFDFAATIFNDKLSMDQ